MGTLAMKPAESTIEMARRHVAEGETLVRKQRALCDLLAQSTEMYEIAVQVKANLDLTLAVFREHLSELEKMHHPYATSHPSSGEQRTGHGAVEPSS